MFASRIARSKLSPSPSSPSELSEKSPPFPEKREDSTYRQGSHGIRSGVAALFEWMDAGSQVRQHTTHATPTSLLLRTWQKPSRTLHCESRATITQSIHDWTLNLVEDLLWNKPHPVFCPHQPQVLRTKEGLWSDLNWAHLTGTGPNEWPAPFG